MGLDIFAVPCGADPSCVAALRVMAKQQPLDDISNVSMNVSLLIEGDFVGQAEVAVALPVVEDYLTKAVVTSWVVERPGREVLIQRRKGFSMREVSDYCTMGI